ncbi:MAG: RnfABCDGE type electron transport complex subunit G [Gammaproteobacteria bacterium]|jgi:electron transport complex protein RnfG|nr:RnfABCDGE type electron transport complex subunit G [Pseudomonadota bacterium]MCH9048330.1 RnfABCDGE type electron transport complex subunit G [Pseudomonadota bacterium]TDJ20032.1 MAG: RnfABCDGE type electron transport complex subunit G [Gammaproteobacteria bacterium]
MKFPHKNLLPLIILAGLCAIVLSITHDLSKERISENIRMEKLQVIGAVMPPDFDNNIYDDLKVINYSDDSGNQVTTTVYRARRSDQPVGVVFMPIPAKGYNGTIHLSIGIHYDGTLSGVQVLKHQETEGLGGNIHQDKTDWLKLFANQSFDITPMESWAIKDEAGIFDQLSGATITSRGVINAVKNSLELYMIEQDALFSD